MFCFLHVLFLQESGRENSDVGRRGRERREPSHSVVNRMHPGQSSSDISRMNKKSRKSDRSAKARWVDEVFSFSITESESTRRRDRLALLLAAAVLSIRVITDFRVDERRGISSCLRGDDEAEVTIRYFLSVGQERGSERERAFIVRGGRRQSEEEEEEEK